MCWVSVNLLKIFLPFAVAVFDLIKKLFAPLKKFKYLNKQDTKDISRNINLYFVSFLVLDKIDIEEEKNIL